MLKKCAPNGFTWDPKDHHIHVTVGSRTYRTLPTGHGDGEQIQWPHVMKLAQFLEILDCAKRELPILANK